MKKRTQPVERRRKVFYFPLSKKDPAVGYQECIFTPFLAVELDSSKSKSQGRRFLLILRQVRPFKLAEYCLEDLTASLSTKFDPKLDWQLNFLSVRDYCSKKILKSSTLATQSCTSRQVTFRALRSEMSYSSHAHPRI